MKIILTYHKNTTEYNPATGLPMIGALDSMEIPWVQVL